MCASRTGLYAVVLVGGQGLRLRPVTETVPKPLLPLVDRPLLTHLLDHLARHGVDTALLSSPLHESAFHGYSNARTSPPRVRILPELEALGTAGAVASAVREAGLREPFLVLNGDTATDVDVTQLIELHRARRAAATLALPTVADARPFGLVRSDPDGTIRAFSEKPKAPGGGAISAGVYVVDPVFVRDVDGGRATSLEHDVFPALIAAGESVVGRPSNAYWMDVGTLDRYLVAVGDALLGRGPCRAAPAPWVHESASVAGESVIEWSAAVCAGASVGAGARVAHSVLMPGAVVGAGANVLGSIIGPRARVGDGADVRDSILGAFAGIEGGAAVRDARVRGDDAPDASGQSS
jgi:mannose-1-phosphate guanylyltransferase